MYVENSPLYSVCGVYDDDVIAIICPILVTKNAYPSTTMNKWNGKDISIDNDNGKIVAPAISAGRKEADNTFSGIMMGDWQDEFFVQTGLYGFDHGAMAYAFKQDGTAFIGKSGLGRINFDGNMGIIASGDAKYNIINNKVEWLNNKQPFSYINLTTGDVRLGGGKVTIDGATGNLTADGDITARTLTATWAGKIGCFNITQTWLYSEELDENKENVTGSVYLSSSGIGLGLQCKIDDKRVLNDSNFFVTPEGFLSAKHAYIGNWTLNNSILQTTENGVINFIKPGETKATTTLATNGLQTPSINISSNLTLESGAYLNGFIRLLEVQTQKFKLSKGGKRLEGTFSVPGYSAAAILRVTSGNTAYGRISGFRVFPTGDGKFRWYVYLTKTPDTKKRSFQVTIQFLLIKSNNANNIIPFNSVVLKNDISDNVGVDVSKDTMDDIIIDLDNSNEKLDTDDIEDTDPTNVVTGPTGENVDGSEILSQYARLDGANFTKTPTVNNVKVLTADIYLSDNNSTTLTGLATRKWVDNHYSEINHNHNSTYSKLTHSHDGTYSKTNHTHPSLENRIAAIEQQLGII